MRTWQPFYDPLLYEMKIGPGGRVADTYVHLVGDKPLDCLEFGCGTGEIAIALARRGHRVTGVDRSSAMLRQAKHNASSLLTEQQVRLSWYEGDMTSTDLSKQFDRVLLTNDLITHLLNDVQIVNFFTLCRIHLKADGSLLMDIPKVDLKNLSAAMEPGGAYYVHGVFPLAADGRSVWVAEQVNFDPREWTMTKTFEYKYISVDGTVERIAFRELVQRPWTTQDVQFALKLAGYNQVEALQVPEDKIRTFWGAMIN